jgi:thiol-disulfide isomerase/thioredoxin
MTVFEASVLVLWALLIVMVVLLLAILRRLREHEADLAQFRPPPSLMAGEPAPDFTATTLDGVEVSRTAAGGGDTVLAFFASGCSACKQHLPGFRRVAAAARGRGAQVLAIIEGNAETAEPILAGLEREVPAVLAPFEESSLIPDYRVRVFPTYVAIDAGGTVAATAPSPAKLATALDLT